LGTELPETQMKIAATSFDFFNEWPKRTEAAIEHLDHQVRTKRQIKPTEVSSTKTFKS
jgi:hypothetical protein